MTVTMDWPAAAGSASNSASVRFDAPQSMLDLMAGYDAG